MKDSGTRVDTTGTDALFIEAKSWVSSSAMSGGIRVVFNGVRGSTPCAGPEYARYGGHSSSVALEVDGAAPVLFDMGTGLRPYGARFPDAFHGSVLLTHLHWDHVQGLPFFTPLHKEGATCDIYGPRQADGPLGDVFAQMMCPPFFPITPSQLAGDVRFHGTGDDDFPIGTAKVRSRWVRHVGPTLGYRVDWNGVSVAYIPDHGPGCCPDDPDDFVPQEMLELCDGVDVLIHDAQHTKAEYEAKRHWGHCTIDYAAHVARESGARNLVLFHHDPVHGDDAMDEILDFAGEESARIGGPEVVAAYEGLELQVAPPTRPTR
jgi:phosphoribosyl 1,2-cyclic phosphodiesterase